MYNIATANRVVTGNICRQTLIKTKDFLIFTELLTKRSNNESIVELNKTDQFVPAAKKRIKM